MCIRDSCSNNYGPWQYPEKLIPKIIINALQNLRIPIYGDGKNIRDWLFVEDHAEALIEVNGFLPYIIRYINTPYARISVLFVYPVLFIISGDI